MYWELSTRLIKKCLLSHRCVWCGEKIESKESAMYRVYIYEGEFQYDYLHPECQDALNMADDLEDGFDEGQFKRGSTENKHGSD